MKKTPSDLEISGALAAANRAVAHGVALRTKHRRRTSPGGGLRDAEFAPVLRELHKAARPIRVLRGMEASHPEVMAHQDELTAASLAIRGEKRRLKKMLR